MCFKALLQIRWFLRESKTLRERGREEEKHIQTVTSHFQWGWRAGREFFKNQGKKTVRCEVLRELDFYLIVIKTTKSHSEHGLRIQRHEWDFRALVRAIIKGRCPGGRGQFVTTKETTGKFLRQPAATPLRSVWQTAARENKGRVAAQRRLSFTPCPGSDGRSLHPNIRHLSPFIFSLSLQITQVTEFPE